MPYAWTTDDDYLPHDAVIVGVGGMDAAMIAEGLPYFEPMSSVSWFSQVTDQGVFSSGGEVGYTVPAALKRAEELRQIMGVRRVFLTLQERGMWQDQWGELEEEPEA